VCDGCSEWVGWYPAVRRWISTSQLVGDWVNSSNV
jgi:hypothetical protein